MIYYFINSDRLIYIKRKDMKSKKLLFYIISSIFLYGCDLSSPKEEIKYHEIEVDLKSVTSYKVKDFFNFDSAIKLETTTESLIAKIEKIAFYNNNIYILDFVQSCLFVFDEEGDFLYKIDKKGDGPKNYIYLTDFHIDQNNKLLYLYDGIKGEILKYSINGDLFLEKKNITKSYCVYHLEDGKWVTYMGNLNTNRPNDHYNVYLLDNDFNFIQSAIPYNTNLHGRRASYGRNSSLSYYDDQLYITPHLSNQIYKYKCGENHESVDLAYEINFKGNGQMKIDENSNQEQVEEYLSKVRSDEVAWGISNFYKMGECVFFNFLHKEKKGILSCFYNEKDKKTLLCDFTGDENGLSFFPTVYTSNYKKEKVLSIVDAQNILISQSIAKTPNPVIERIAQSINQDEEANPILIFYTFKGMEGK